MLDRLKTMTETMANRNPAVVDLVKSTVAAVK